MAGTQNQELRGEILTENLWRLMMRMSLPAIIAMSVNAVNTFVDGLFVGQYVGQNALAAISLVLPLTMITNGISALIGMGSSSLLSIAIGSGDVDIQKKVFGTLTLLSVLFSIVLTGLGLYFASDLLAMMGGRGEIQELGTLYYQIILIGSFFRIFAVAANVLIRAEGKVKEAMTYSIITTLLNIFLNPLFIVYFEMGVAGAAWSTVAAMFVFTLFDLWYFFSNRTSYPVDLKKYSLEKKLLKPIFSVGVSAMMLQIMFFVQQLVVFRSLAHYGDDWDIAFMGACYRIFLIALVPGFGFAQAMQPIVGINYGAGEYNRVKKSYHIFAACYTIFLLLTWGFIMIMPRMTLGWMLPDATFTNQDILNFRLMLSTLPLFPYFMMGTTLFQSIGNARAAGYALVARDIIIFIPVVLLLPIWFGVPGIYAAGIPVNIIMLIVVAFMVEGQFKKWQGKEVRGQIEK